MSLKEQMILKLFNGLVWRLINQNFSSQPYLPAKAPDGRFHHSGQTAIYTSLTPEGTQVAIKRYLTDKIPRVLCRFELNATRVADIRNDPVASMVWQDIVAEGRLSPTWKYSNSARDAGAQAMLYSSRSQPELTHAVIFDPKCLNNAQPVTYTPQTL